MRGVNRIRQGATIAVLLLGALGMVAWDGGNVVADKATQILTVEQEAHPDTTARLLGEAHAQHGPSDRLFHYRIYADSTIFIRALEEEGAALEIPAMILHMMYGDVDRRLFDAGPPQARMTIGYEAGALEFSVTRQYDALLLGGVGGGSVLLFGLIGWLWVRLRREQEEQRRLRARNRALTDGQEAERKRLARELHDGPLQALHTMQLYFPADDSLRDDLLHITKDLRAMSAGLHPSSLERFGLAAALREHIERVEEVQDQQASICFELSANEKKLGLSEEEQLALFRIGQEAITNALRHAEASRIVVRLTADERSVELVVEDDGQGFGSDQRSSEENATRPGHLGLVGMKERADMVEAALDVDSIPGRGTTVRVRLSKSRDVEEKEREKQDEKW